MIKMFVDLVVSVWNKTLFSIMH